MTKTTLPKQSEIVREWYEVDASEFTLGRLSSRIAQILRGKHKPTYTPHMDTGDFVVVLNPGQIRVTGQKMTNKKYYHYSGYPGGITEKKMAEYMDKAPEKIIQMAVRNMLSRTRLRSEMMKRLKFAKEGTHTYKIDHKLNK